MITHAGVAETNLIQRDFEEQPGCVVRSMFKKTETGWQISTDTVESLFWNILYNGKKLISISGKLNYPEDTGFLMRDISYEIPCNVLPHIGKKSRTFSGWPDVPIYRPLIATTSSFISRPLFKKYNVLTADIGIISSFIWSKLNQDSLLDYVYNGLNKDSSVNHSISKDSLINSINHAYSFGPNRILICVDLNICMETIRQKRPFNEFLYDSHIWDMTGKDSYHEFTKNAWFYISDGEVTYIDFKMLLLDYGDLDGDGKSEVIFRMEKYNNDGYILFSERNKQIIKYDWSYH
ncbi:MAG TPA: hypothetical protein VN451_03715 [Chitinophagaceae bacterium]|nr:hypothetical protein [Chitinophagaceae bacterium]